MSRYAELVTADRRLQILRLLAESAGYTASAELLHTVLESLGHGLSHDRLDAELAWLDEQGLIALERLAELSLARLTARGADVAAGRASVPGVARPGPL